MLERDQQFMSTMKAVSLSASTKGKDIKLTERNIPEVKPGWVLVRVYSFGLNHSEKLLRLSEINASYINKPITPGIECAGEIIDPSDTAFRVGQRVIALMGGMGRSFDGSYAEYTLLPANQVFSVKTDLTWTQLGAIPETYYTAWGSLFDCLHLEQSDKLLVRGGTCPLGYAAIQIAKALGCEVVATTHRVEKFKLLNNCGVDQIVLDEGEIKEKVFGITKVLELVGVKTLRDSLKSIESVGIVCNTGILGGQYTLDGFDPIKEIPNGVYLTGFYSNTPTQRAIDEMMAFLCEANLLPHIGHVYDFSQIAEASEALETGNVDGKIVIRVV